MDKDIPTIYSLVQELSWDFGSQGFNGECCEDLSLAEFMALKKVHELEHITIQEIGENLNFTKSGASKIVDRLENKGYVVRENSPIDGRVCFVAITNKGTDIASKIIQNFTRYLGDVLVDLEPNMIELIKKALEILVARVQINKPVINSNTQRGGECS